MVAVICFVSSNVDLLNAYIYFKGTPQTKFRNVRALFAWCKFGIVYNK